MFSPNTMNSYRQQTKKYLDEEQTLAQSTHAGDESFVSEPDTVKFEDDDCEESVGGALGHSASSHDETVREYIHTHEHRLRTVDLRTDSRIRARMRTPTHARTHARTPCMHLPKYASAPTHDTCTQSQSHTHTNHKIQNTKSKHKHKTNKSDTRRAERAGDQISVKVKGPARARGHKYGGRARSRTITSGGWA